ncbi:hypothetical protein Ciccas_000508 [Cichlidogyrus casuarinus]|uniref:Uncharacterized protein n=1 Tax=Cichlidogyrus casuarinus TaxID=1844966 RepID=A0ABD2QMS6_9PLAT
MDASLKEHLNDYIKSETVLKCLVLTGFTTCKVFMGINDKKISDIETYIKETCSLMSDQSELESYVGPIFAQHPEQFRFPTGIVSAIMLAADALRDQKNVVVETSVQTDISLPITTVLPSLPVTTPAFLSSLHGVVSKGDSNGDMNNDSSPLTHVSSSCFNNSLTSPHTPFPALNGEASKMDEISDLEKLKQISTANCTRIVSRQFINASLLPGRDFDIEMELAMTKEGVKRVTGIYFCHLCREKRERVHSVRFSIARNRYPIMSNVISHLKTHFSFSPSIYQSQSTAHILLTTTSNSDFSLKRPHEADLSALSQITPMDMSSQSWPSEPTNPIKSEPDSFYE